MFTWSRRQERASAVDHMTNPLCAQTSQVETDTSGLAPLKLLSFNIQVGIKTTGFSQYLTRGWKHVLPHSARQTNLNSIAALIEHFDIVGLQEVDAGSLRSGFINQVEYLASCAQFPYWYTQLNRDLGPLAQHGNGLLSRYKPLELEDHKLPGTIPGRGAMFLRVPYAGDELVLVMLHLSLGERSRRAQLDYVAEQVANERQVIVMGDMNARMRPLLEQSPLKKLDLQPANVDQPTYPAWQPSVALDHVLVSSNLKVNSCEVLPCQVSDHLPVAVEVSARELPSIQ